MYLLGHCQGYPICLCDKIGNNRHVHDCTGHIDGVAQGQQKAADGVNPNFSEARILDGSTAIFEVVLKTMSSGSCIASRNCLGVILQIKNSIGA